MQKFADGIKIENHLNRDGDILPFGYFCPESDGKVVWICGEDAAGKITSVFSSNYEGRKDRQVKYLDTIEDARFMRDELVKNGWQKLKVPEVKLTVPDASGKNVPLSRKQKRYISRKLNQGKLPPGMVENPVFDKDI